MTEDYENEKKLIKDQAKASFPIFNFDAFDTLSAIDKQNFVLNLYEYMNHDKSIWESTLITPEEMTHRRYCAQTFLLKDAIEARNFREGFKDDWGYGEWFFAKDGKYYRGTQPFDPSLLDLIPEPYKSKEGDQITDVKSSKEEAITLKVEELEQKFSTYGYTLKGVFWFEEN